METLKYFKKAALTVIASAFLCSYAFGQAVNTPSYKTAIGMRVGGTTGLTIKHFFASDKAVEGILGVWPNAFSITGVYEKHKASPTLSGFQWYYGIGAHFTHYANRVYYGYYYDDRPPRRYYYRYRYVDAGAAIGVDGMLGMEYKIPEIPFAISLDLKPYVEFHTNNTIYMALDPGLGIKFTF